MGYLCNISRKTWRIKLIFLLAYNHQSFLAIDTISLSVCGQVCHKCPNTIAISLQYIKKKVSYEVDFLHADKHQSFYKLISTLWTLKFPGRWYYHYWWAWSIILKLLKVTSLQYIYNISKKKSGMEFMFWYANKSF